ncbi:MAG: HD domain-containing protein [Candidatus Altiarchaeota archaeon]|nr:HD domain-containing protein [Candidatus Altiarchaeota archaeon]
MKEFVKFMFELQHLKKIKHEGWRLAGVSHPDTVAEHTANAAQIAYILAQMEGHENPEKIATMVLFHDIAETRIGDIHYLGINYVKRDEKRVVEDQTSNMGEVGKKIRKMWLKFEDRQTEESKIAKDADRLEQALQAKEYVEQSYKEAQDWINNIRVSLFTKSAKELLKIIEKSDSKSWWRGKKKILDKMR